MKKLTLFSVSRMQFLVILDDFWGFLRIVGLTSTCCILAREEEEEEDTEKGKAWDGFNVPGRISSFCHFPLD